MTGQFFCPACEAESTVDGRPFASEWKVVSHVAGKIQSGDGLHRAWVRKYAPDADLSRKGSRLGEELSLVIHQALKVNNPVKAPATIQLTRSLVDQIQEIELRLHAHIKRRLQDKHGTKNDTWWYEGIPEAIRLECAQRRERDKGKQEPFQYTYLIDLKSVLDRNWALLEHDFARLRGLVSSKKAFLDQVSKLNEVRNRHFHPIRAPRPNSRESVEDLAFVSGIMRAVKVFCYDGT